jgi:UDP-N-acetylmuramoylalanine--D-glutamate ligase
LICEILREAGLDPIKVGIGQVSVLDRLKELKEKSIVVFELSSWRLSALGRYGLSPEIAVITNIFQDHLNYYPNMGEYIQDKKYIFSSQKKSDFCVLNWDDERLRSIEKEVPSRIIKFSDHAIDQEKSVYISDNSIYVNKKGAEEKVLDVDEIEIRGIHNRKNILASIGAAQALDVGTEAIRRGVLSFVGVPHRLEFVRDLDGVKYYNDTAATSPDGAISSLDSFDEPLVLIAGGADKNLDMKELAGAIRKKTDRTIFLKGIGTDKIIAELRNIGKKGDFTVVDSMDKAVTEARKLAKKGDVVLLSPGTASFGIFLNEFDRGDKFKSAVNSLR